MHVLSFCTGLQASPSKHNSYSVRMENAVPIVTQAPGAQPLQIQPGLLTQVWRHHRDGTNGVFWGVLIITVLELLIFRQSSLHPFFHEPLLRIVSIDGGWKSLSVHDPASTGSCFFFSWVHSGSTVHCSLPLTLSPFAPLSWRLRLPWSDAHKGRRLSHRVGLHWSLHSRAGALTGGR